MLFMINTSNLIAIAVEGKHLCWYKWASRAVFQRSNFICTCISHQSNITTGHHWLLEKHERYCWRTDIGPQTAPFDQKARLLWPHKQWAQHNRRLTGSFLAVWRLLIQAASAGRAEMWRAQAPSDTSINQSVSERRSCYGSEALVNIIDYAIKVSLAGHHMWRNDQAETNATKHKTKSLAYSGAWMLWGL